MSVVMGCIVPHPPVLIPEIGGPRVREIGATRQGMDKLASELAATAPDTVVLISPHGRTHHFQMGVATAAGSFGDLSMWGPQDLSFEFKSDLDFVSALQNECRKGRVPLQTIGDRGYELDHGALVPLYFLRSSFPGARLVPLTFSWLDMQTHFAFGQAINRAAAAIGKRVALIASGDLSHRLTEDAPAGYDPDGAVFDHLIAEAVRKWDTRAVLNLDLELVQRAGECGLRSIIILMGTLDGLRVRPEVLSYEGPFGVGYMVASVLVETAPVESVRVPGARVAHPVISLARQTVESYIGESQICEATIACPEMAERAGVFVCLKKRGELRGCIGTFEPNWSNVAEEIVQNAISAATRDPRFPPVRVDELTDLAYSVDILSSPEPIEGLHQLDPRRYGVIVECGGRRGLLLPDLDGVDTAEQQVDIARRKAYIGPSETIGLYRFAVRRFEE